jgi:hypothetical protein
MAKNCRNSQCGKEIPSSATFCMFCGTQQIETEKLSEEEKLRKELGSMQDTIQLLKKALTDAQQNNDSSTENNQVVQSLKKQLADLQNKNKAMKALTIKESIPDKTKPFPTNVLVVGIALLLIISSIVGYFGFYQPYAIDRNAPRFYSFATNTFLRSSQEAGVDYNKLGTVPYGSELITYNYGTEWSEVKWNNPENGESIKGFISSNYILPESDFKILNSIWGDSDSKEVINTGKCRIALLNYFRDNNYSGTWQVFSKPKEIKPNTTYFSRIADRNSKFTDFAVIIRNSTNGERKCLIFKFDDDETSHLVYDEFAPLEGLIGSISYSSDNGYYIHYR